MKPMAMPAALAALMVTTMPVQAADAVPHLDGRDLGTIWLLPFAGLLLSIAILPLAAPRLWHHHYGKIAMLWALAFLLPLLVGFGGALTLHELLHTALLEYLPFIILVAALFVVAGGIHIAGNLHGSPLTNTVLLATGTGLASFIGTTGASMVMIRPVLRANDDRRHNVHVVVFFIFLVSNIGGALTPLGDPPLFLGFLKGVSFFWPLQHLWLPTLLLVLVLLAAFYALDSWLYAREGHLPRDPTPDAPIRVEGLVNVGLLALLVLVVLASGLAPDLGALTISTVEVPVAGMLRDAALIAIILASIQVTPPRVHAANDFSWGPVREVAKLFAGIFVTIIPAIAILRAGNEGALAFLVDVVTSDDGTPSNLAYFWITGGLSSFLDNAPTYLVFFNAAGGDPAELMGPLAGTLAAISAGAVYMGANSYIGNAPNFMVKSIAEGAGVRMPSFFGYMAWSGAVLLPCFLVIGWLFFG